MANTGNITVTERDNNPLSPTYNTTRTRTYVDTDRCTLPVTNYKVMYTMPNGTTGSIQCNADSKLTSNDYSNIAGSPLYYMKTAVIGTCVETIGVEAFMSQYLTDITIPNSVTKISGEVTYSQPMSEPGFTASLNGCLSLKSITIPESVTEIAEVSFQRCGLTSFNLPKSVTTIKAASFNVGGAGFLLGCEDIATLTVDQDNPVYDSRNNCNAVIHTSTNTLIQGCKNTVIPNTVTSIAEMAFEDYGTLTSITIPNSVTVIGKHAFEETGLSSVHIPASVISIGERSTDIYGGRNPFAGCRNLTTITVDPNNTRYDSRNNCNAIMETSTNELVSGCKNTVIPNDTKIIGEAAFFRCTDFSSITIPSTVTTIGNQAFYSTSNTVITFLPTVPPSLTGSQHFLSTGGLTIYVPAASVNAYKTAAVWSAYASYIQAIPS